VLAAVSSFQVIKRMAPKIVFLLAYDAGADRELECYLINFCIDILRSMKRGVEFELRQLRFS
jgi:hypothetical protein